jgi:hypothetical protein
MGKTISLQICLRQICKEIVFPMSARRRQDFVQAEQMVKKEILAGQLMVVRVIADTCSEK